jgi:hypothetical protein
MPNEMVPIRNERDERWERAGYLLIVGTDRFVRAVAAFVWRIARSVMEHGVTRRQIGTRRSAGRTKDLGSDKADQRALRRPSKPRADAEQVRRQSDLGLAAGSLIWTGFPTWVMNCRTGYDHCTSALPFVRPLGQHFGVVP